MGDNDKPTTLEAYRRFLQETSWYVHANEDNAPEYSYLFHGLCGEAGEANDAFKKVIREVGYFSPQAFHVELDRPEVYRKVVHELGDVLWYLTRLADKLGLTLEDLAVLNTRKLFLRLKENGKLPATYPWPLPRHTFRDESIIKLFGVDPSKCGEEGND